ncbi:hypothetical protein B0H17DRAFT_1153991 [Mycena rosella]|uniref:Uncharacterized protein n=1 Tax=Mycena rosella TaxID=1033263 RepID=A0AAD7B1C0_MYCRO|nr:hypothetical protein B0H17DRAFT_1153991 [Mycena rosella]
MINNFVAVQGGLVDSWVKCVPQYPGDKYLASISNVHVNSERKKLKPASFRNQGLSCRNTEAAAHNPRHIEHRGCISGGPAGRGPQLEEKVAKLQDPKSTEARSEAEVTPSGLEISGLLDESMEWRLTVGIRVGQQHRVWRLEIPQWVICDTEKQDQELISESRPRVKLIVAEISESGGTSTKYDEDTVRVCIQDEVDGGLAAVTRGWPVGAKLVTGRIHVKSSAQSRRSKESTSAAKAERSAFEALARSALKSTITVDLSHAEGAGRRSAGGADVEGFVRIKHTWFGVLEHNHH